MQHILIVDDNIGRQAALCQVLAERGSGAVLVSGAAQAQAVLARKMVSAMILPLGLMSALAPLATGLPLICLAQCDESGVGAVFAMSPMVFAVMDPDTPPAVVADLVTAAIRDSATAPVPEKIVADKRITERPMIERAVLPAPARRLTLA